MKRFTLLAAVLFLIVLGFAQRPAPLLAQENATGCSNAPARYLPQFRSGWDTIVRVADVDGTANRLRSNHSLTAEVTLLMPVNDAMVLLASDPVCEDGYRWYFVAIVKNGTTYVGWTADGQRNVRYLELVVEVDLSVTPTASATPRATRTPLVTPVPATPGATRTPVPTTVQDCSLAPLRRLVVNSWARVISDDNRASNFRRTAGLSGEIIAEIQPNTAVYVVSGPVCADGFRWWRVRYSGMLGWVGDGAGSEYYLEPAATQG